MSKKDEPETQVVCTNSNETKQKTDHLETLNKSYAGK